MRHGRTPLRGLDGAREIISDVPSLYAALDRVNVTRPVNINERTPGKTWQNN